MSLTIKPNTTVVTLLQGDDLDPITERAQTVQRTAETEAPSRLNDDAPDKVAEAAKAYDKFIDEALERAVKVKMTAIPRKAYRTLLNEHPPRTVAGPEGPVEHDQDAGWGFNRETFGDALVPLCVDLDQFEGSENARLEFLDGLSDGWFAKLYSAAVSLNQSGGPNTKVRLSSLTDPTSDETSPSPARLA